MNAQNHRLTEDDLVDIAVAVGLLPDEPVAGPADLPEHLVATPDHDVVLDLNTGALLRRPAYARRVVAA